jgi:hypothetical protein
MSDAFTETLALSIPKLNFTVDSGSEPGLALVHATQFNVSVLFCTMQSGQSHVPGGFLNLLSNPRPTLGDDLVANTGLCVSQA